MMLTRRSIVHPGRDRHEEESIPPYSLIDILDYTSVEFAFAEGAQSGEEYTNSKERYSLCSRIPRHQLSMHAE